MSNTMHKFNNHSYNDYEEDFYDNDYNNDYALNFNYNILINNSYKCKYLHNKKYSFPEKKGFTFKKNQYK